MGSGLAGPLGSIPIHLALRAVRVVVPPWFSRFLLAHTMIGSDRSVQVNQGLPQPAHNGTYVRSGFSGLVAVGDMGADLFAGVWIAFE